MAFGTFATKIKAVVNDLTSAEMANINSALFIDTFGVSNFAGAHTFVPARHGGLIPIIDNSTDFGAFSTSNGRSCALTSETMVERYDSKKWELTEVGGRYGICLKTLEEDFLVFWNTHKLVKEDPTQEPEWADYIEFLTQRAKNNLTASHWRVGYLGDKSLTTNSKLNGINGFFVQASAGGGVKQTIEHVGATPTGSEIYEGLRTAYESASEQSWFDENEVVIKMTKKMAQTLVNYLNRLSDTSEFDVAVILPNEVVKSRKFSVDGLHIFGIKVEAHSEIDRSMDAVTSPTQNKFQAIIAKKSNLLVGSPEVDKLEQFDMFYDKKDNQIYIDVLGYFGVAIATDEYVYIDSEQAEVEEEG